MSRVELSKFSLTPRPRRQSTRKASSSSLLRPVVVVVPPLAVALGLHVSMVLGKQRRGLLNELLLRRAFFPPHGLPPVSALILLCELERLLKIRTMLRVGVLATVKTANQRKLLLVVTPRKGDALALTFNIP